MENEIPGFNEEYEIYERWTRYGVDIMLVENGVGLSAAQRTGIDHEFKNLDVKMRLAFGIRDILLNNQFVDDKQGPLKDCHKLYYKLADLWFAYETFLKFLGEVLDKDITKKIEWIGDGVHGNFCDLRWVEQALQDANESIFREFGTAPRSQELEVYLRYCEAEAKGDQLRRLSHIIPHLRNHGLLSHIDMLTIAYSIRNNFAHNGETTVVPDNFTFENKGRLLGILYRYLAISLLSWVNEASRSF